MNSSIKKLLRQMSPPIVWETLRRIRNAGAGGPAGSASNGGPAKQDLDIYWTAEMADALETWGDGNVWHEIRYLLATCRGRVLDIACGTGKTMILNSQNPNLELHGCDISDMLIQKAVDRGIDAGMVKVADATQMDYPDDSFAYSYSIGSLEHFTEEGIGKFISECHRVTSHGSFHMIPVSRSGANEGWMKTEQSFFNNSSDWWLAKFRQRYENVMELESLWNDPQSNGRWFLCFKD